MSYMPHKNESIPALHEYYVSGIIDEIGPAYVYCMTSMQPVVDSFIRDLSKAIRFKTPDEFEQRKRAYPGLHNMRLFKVAVTEISD